VHLIGSERVATCCHRTECDSLIRIIPFLNQCISNRLNLFHELISFSEPIEQHTDLINPKIGMYPTISINLCPLPSVLGCGADVAAQGVRTPFASPNGEQQGGFGVDPSPTCAGSSRWVPSLEGLGLANLKTPRCLPQRVEVAACRPGPPWFLLAPAPAGSIWLWCH
jgi:hypothetical protein